LGGITIYGLYRQLYLNLPFGDNPVSSNGLIVISVLIFLFIILFALFYLKTEINAEAIHFRFFPFVRKTIPWQNVKSAEVLNYGFVGGWGIRLWTSYGTVYNVRGKMGLALELNNGKKLLIGTQKPDELAAFLNEMYKTSSDIQT
jgi:hypothetical protein